MKTSKNRIFIIFSILLMGIFIDIFYEGYTLYTKELRRIDNNLYRAAKTVPYYIGNDYHTKDMKEKSRNNEEVYVATKSLMEIAHLNNLDHMFTIILDNNEPIYTLVGGGNKKFENFFKENKNNLPHWVDFKSISSSTITETVNFFKSNGEQPLYFTQSNKYGKFRSIYILFTSDDGSNYIAGAHITITTLNKNIFETVSFHLLHTTIILAILIFFGFVGFKYKQELKLQSELAKYDELTGTLRREAGIKSVNELIKDFPSHENNLFLGLFDIVDLSYINENFGTPIGDKMILKLTNVLKSTFKGDEKIIRFSGDQFLVAIIESADGRGIVEFQEIFEEKLQELNFSKDGKPHIAVRKVFLELDNEKALNPLLNNLFEKLRFEKGNHKNQTLSMELEIQRGIHEKEFEVFYQPKVDVMTKEIEFEALIRWNHPTKGIISPTKFIPVAESSSLIVPLTEFLITQVKKDLEKLKTRVSVNISPTHFNREFFLEEMLHKYDNLDGIDFELTENNFINEVNSSITKVNALKKLGINFLMDDFGTGYSSMSSLAKLPISTLKIDRSFVLNMFKSYKDEKIIRILIALGKALNLKIVVEGVEEVKEIDFLTKLGAYIFQGYYFGKPESLKTVVEKLEKGTYLEKLKELDLQLDEFESKRSSEES